MGCEPNSPKKIYLPPRHNQQDSPSIRLQLSPCSAIDLRLMDGKKRYVMYVEGHYELECTDDYRIIKHGPNKHTEITVSNKKSNNRMILKPTGSVTIILTSAENKAEQPINYNDKGLLSNPKKQGQQSSSNPSSNTQLTDENKTYVMIIEGHYKLECTDGFRVSDSGTSKPSEITAGQKRADSKTPDKPMILTPTDRVTITLRSSDSKNENESDEGYDSDDDKKKKKKKKKKNGDNEDNDEESDNEDDDNKEDEEKKKREDEENLRQQINQGIDNGVKKLEKFTACESQLNALTERIQVLEKSKKLSNLEIEEMKKLAKTVTDKTEHLRSIHESLERIKKLMEDESLNEQRLKELATAVKSQNTQLVENNKQKIAIAVQKKKNRGKTKDKQGNIIYRYILQDFNQDSAMHELTKQMNSVIEATKQKDDNHKKTIFNKLHQFLACSDAGQQ